MNLYIIHSPLENYNFKSTICDMQNISPKNKEKILEKNTHKMKENIIITELAHSHTRHTL